MFSPKVRIEDFQHIKDGRVIRVESEKATIRHLDEFIVTCTFDEVADEGGNLDVMKDKAICFDSFGEADSFWQKMTTTQLLNLSSNPFAMFICEWKARQPKPVDNHRQ